MDDHMTGTASGLGAYASTLQHISLMNAKLQRLEALQAQAEEQLIYRMSCDYAAGRVGIEQVYEIYLQLKPMCVKQPGKRGFDRV